MWAIYLCIAMFCCFFNVIKFTHATGVEITKPLGFFLGEARQRDTINNTNTDTGNLGGYSHGGAQDLRGEAPPCDLGGGLLNNSAMDLEGVEVFITFDDGPFVSCISRDDLLKKTTKLLDVLDKYGIRAALFVISKQVFNANGEMIPHMLDILRLWQSRGHIICNHTHSHYLYSRVGFEKFKVDFLKCHQLLSYMDAARWGWYYFRSPGLDDGKNLKHKQLLQELLHQNAYKNIFITVDSKDYLFNKKYLLRLDEKIKKDYRKYVLQQFENSVNYCKKKFSSVRMGGKLYKPPQVILFHMLQINTTEVLEEILANLVSRGVKFVSLERVFMDPLFMIKERTTLNGCGIQYRVGARELQQFIDGL